MLNCQNYLSQKRRRAQTVAGTKYPKSLIYQMTDAFPSALCYSKHLQYPGQPIPHRARMSAAECFGFSQPFILLSLFERRRDNYPKSTAKTSSAGAAGTGSSNPPYFGNKCQLIENERMDRRPVFGLTETNELHCPSKQQQQQSNTTNSDSSARRHPELCQCSAEILCWWWAKSDLFYQHTCPLI